MLNLYLIIFSMNSTWLACSTPWYKKSKIKHCLWLMLSMLSPNGNSPRLPKCSDNATGTLWKLTLLNFTCNTVRIGYRFIRLEVLWWGFEYVVFASANPLQLYNYIRQCLATEMRLIQAATGEGFQGLPNLLGNSASTEIMHKLEVLRNRTRVKHNSQNPLLDTNSTFFCFL